MNHIGQSKKEDVPILTHPLFVAKTIFPRVETLRYKEGTPTAFWVEAHDWFDVGRESPHSALLCVGLQMEMRWKRKGNALGTSVFGVIFVRFTQEMLDRGQELFPYVPCPALFQASAPTPPPPVDSERLQS